MRINDKGVLIGYHDDPTVTRLVIPERVKRIAADAFYGAEYLEEIVIPEGVREISTGAFRGCHVLRSVSMPDSVTRLGRTAFGECRSLREVRLSAGLTDIPARAFNGCQSLESVYIPDGVKSIGQYAFNSCIALTSVRLPDTLSFMDTGAFMETFSLKSISIPDGVDSIESYTFFRSGLEQVSYRGMELFFDRDGDIFNTFELCFTEELSDWLEKGGSGSECLPRELRMPFLLAYFVKTRSPAAGEFVRKNFPKLLARSIRLGDIGAVTAFIEEGFLSTRNITRYINMAAEQNRHEIYLMLMTHKEKLGGFGAKGSARFKL